MSEIQHEHHYDMAQAGHAYTPDGTKEAFVDFPMDQIYQDLDGDESVNPRDRIPEFGSALIRIFQWLLFSGLRGVSRRDRKGTMIRLETIVALISPETIGSKVSLQDIGKRYGVTKAAVSAIGLDFADRFGVHFRRQFRQSSRLKLSKSQMGHVNHFKGAKRHA